MEWTKDRGCPPRVRRLVVPAVAVDLVVVGAASWRSGLRRASVFVTDATRTVLLTRHHSPARLARIAWEVDASGTGLWVREGWGEPARVVEVR